MKKGAGGKTIILFLMSWSFWTSAGHTVQCLKLNVSQQAGIVCMGMWTVLIEILAEQCCEYIWDFAALLFSHSWIWMKIHMCFEFVSWFAWSTRATNKLAKDCILSCCYESCKGSVHHRSAWSCFVLWIL